MQRKFKVVIIVLVVLVVVLTLTLCLLSLSRLENNYYGLNFDRISSSYSDSRVYSSGLHYIGLANSFIKISRVATILSLNQLQLYTSDFQLLQASLQIEYGLNSTRITTTSNTTISPFEALKKYYDDFGQQPRHTIQPILKAATFATLSRHSCQFYQTMSSTALQSLQSSIVSLFKAKVASFDILQIDVRLESLSCGASPEDSTYWSNQIDLLETKLTIGSPMIDLNNYAIHATQLNDKQIQLIKTQIDLRMSVLESAVYSYDPSLATNPQPTIFNSYMAILASCEAVGFNLTGAANSLNLSSLTNLIGTINQPF